MGAETYFAQVKEIKDNIKIEQIFNLLQDWDASPQWKNNEVIIARTICHDGNSHKLYYYDNSKCFQCYTNCNTFDIFKLVQKVFSLRYHQELTFKEAVNWIVSYFKLSFFSLDSEIEQLIDWKKFESYEQLRQMSVSQISTIKLQEYDSKILNYLNYDVILTPWLKEGISQKILKRNRIGYYPGEDYITIPHFDQDNRFIGLRGRAMSETEVAATGKYRPLTINGILYSHPLGLNLYNLNNSKNNIAVMKKAVVFEAEKSCLKIASFFGPENDISVACCGSTFSLYQAQMLVKLGVEEIIVAFDREGEQDNKKQYVQKFYKINKNLKNNVLISFIYDKKQQYLNYKDAPIDQGPEIFMKLFKERIFI